MTELQIGVAVAPRDLHRRPVVILLADAVVLEHAERERDPAGLGRVVGLPRAAASSPGPANRRRSPGRRRRRGTCSRASWRPGRLRRRRRSRGGRRRPAPRGRSRREVEVEVGRPGQPLVDVADPGSGAGSGSGAARRVEVERAGERVARGGRIAGPQRPAPFLDQFLDRPGHGRIIAVARCDRRSVG